MKVLVAEDDMRIRQGLVEVLRREGYETVEAEDGERAMAVWEQEKPDFICLDIMMPGMSGYDVCKEIRAKGSKVPIVFISAKSEEIDKVLGLELGGDDFISKPFGVREVVARIRAVTRRCLAMSPKPDLPSSFFIGGIEVIPNELRAKRNDEIIELSLREVKLLEMFARFSGQVLSREKIFEECWGDDFFPLSRTLDQRMAKLRKRVEPDVKNPTIIETVHGVGYRYDP